MAETKSKKRDSLIDEIGKQSLQTALTPSESAQEQITDKQRSQLIEKKSNMGRPTKYSIELAAKICELLADGNPLRRITRMEGMPTASSVYVWLQQYPDFLDMYTRAREDSADALADEILDIADEQPELINIYDKDGKLVEIKVDTALIAWQKNRMEARKWIAAKLKPRKYGERQILAGDSENPISVTERSEAVDTFLLNLTLIKQTTSKK